MLKIRRYQCGDESALRTIFFNTIRKVNIKDYSASQVKAWAPSDYDKIAWCDRMRSNQPFVAIFEGEIVGYADIQDDGYIDHFFCHCQHQGKGVGRALMQILTDTAIKKQVTLLYSHVSITAKPFFEHFGFEVTKKQSVDIRGQRLTNYVMKKYI